MEEPREVCTENVTASQEDWETIRELAQEIVDEMNCFLDQVGSGENITTENQEEYLQKFKFPDTTITLTNVGCMFGFDNYYISIVGDSIVNEENIIKSYKEVVLTKNKSFYEIKYFLKGENEKSETHTSISRDLMVIIINYLLEVV